MIRTLPAWLVCLCLFWSPFVFAAEEAEGQEEGNRWTAAGMPEIQERFVLTACEAESEHFDALNDLKKLKIKKARDKALKKLLAKSKGIVKWRGTVGMLEVDRKGLVTLIINLPNNEKYPTCQLMMGNMESTGLLKKRYFTKIAHGSKLFDKLSDLDMMDPITFSGSFVVDKQGVPRGQMMDAFYIKITEVQSP